MNFAKSWSRLGTSASLWMILHIGSLCGQTPYMRSNRTEILQIWYSTDLEVHLHCSRKNSNCEYIWVFRPQGSMDWTVFPTNSYVHVLTPSSSKCGCFWSRVIKEAIKSKWDNEGRPPYQWCPFQKRKCGHVQWGETERRRPSKSQGESLQKKTLITPWP